MQSPPWPKNVLESRGVGVRCGAMFDSVRFAAVVQSGSIAGPVVRVAVVPADLTSGGHLYFGHRRRGQRD
eukprot:SAG11_NODE_2678_length_3105_cov_2.120758_7_plen_70_part_00